MNGEERQETGVRQQETGFEADDFEKVALFEIEEESDVEEAGSMPTADELLVGASEPDALEGMYAMVRKISNYIGNLESSGKKIDETKRMRMIINATAELRKLGESIAKIEAARASNSAKNQDVNITKLTIIVKHPDGVEETLEV